MIKSVFLILSLLMSMMSLSFADGGHSGPGGHCKIGDVYCSGECHSSVDMCPGHGDNGHHGNNGSQNCGPGTYWDGWQCVGNGGGFGSPVCPVGYYWNGFQCVW